MSGNSRRCHPGPGKGKAVKSLSQSRVKVVGSGRGRARKGPEVFLAAQRACHWVGLDGGAGADRESLPQLGVRAATGERVGSSCGMELNGPEKKVGELVPVFKELVLL